MATGVQYIFPTGGPETIGINAEYIGEAASQTFKPGSPLKDNGSGFAVEALEDDTDIIGLSINEGQNLSAAGEKRCGYRPWRAGEQFRITLGGTFAITDLRTLAALKKDGTTGAWYAVKAADCVTGDEQQVRIIGFDRRFKAADTDVVVIVEVVEKSEIFTTL